MPSQSRIEHDLLGEKEILDAYYYSIQTLRAVAMHLNHRANA